MHFPKTGTPEKSLTCPLSEAVESCRTTGFTGALLWKTRDRKGSVLFRSGKPLCAEISTQSAGSEALKRIEGDTAEACTDFHPFSAREVDALLLFNEAWRVVEGESDEKGGKTTIKPVKVGAGVRAARIRVVQAVEAGDDPVGEGKSVTAQGRVRKQVLDQVSIESLKKLSENFEADASALLKELQMDHLIVDETRDEQ
ncbi:hypothetical protein [Methanofollis fontis]|uniref:Uncharacterized protein n=1 Tax=Methanofollis fontis TaxID=2052832 RepID=A0A483CU68_9EURY|nr:hypothetical protein [Methanofollis fontis]TAJ44844.1 hypothetical protein CUJ86_06020 [Methanofollis fontis]